MNLEEYLIEDCKQRNKKFMKTYKLKLQLLENGVPIEGATLDLHFDGKKQSAIDFYMEIERQIVEEI